MSHINSKKDVAKTFIKTDLLLWVWPLGTIILVLSKWLSVVSGLVALCLYFLLKRRVRIWHAVLACGALALVAGVGIVSLTGGISDAALHLN